MAGSLKLVTSRDHTRESALKTLEKLRAEIESGETIAISGIAESSDGGYHMFGSETMSRLQTAGALLECAIARLDD